MTACRYTLSITFRSNERPFSTIYDPSPYGPQDDDAAWEWADGMARNLSDYSVTLLKDGAALSRARGEG